MNIKNNFFWISLDKIITTFTSFLIFFYLASFLSPKDYGYIIFYTSLISISYRFSDLGFINDLIREKDYKVNKLFANYFYQDLFCNSVVFLILLLISKIILTIDEFQIFILICLTIYISNITACFKSFAQKKFEFKLISIWAIFFNLGLIISTYIFSLYHKSIYLLVIPNLLLQFLLLVSLWFYYHRFLKLSFNLLKFKKKNLKKRISYLFYGISEEVFLRIDNLVINFYFGKNLLGIYEKIYKYGNLVNNFFGDIIYKFLLPYYGSSKTKNKIQSLIVICKFGIYIYPVVSILFYYFFSFMVKFFLDQSWYEILIYFKYILMFSVFYGIYQNLKSFIITNFLIYEFTKIEIYRLIIFIFTMFIFLKLFGFIGIFGALTLTMIISLLIMFFLIKKLSKINILKKIITPSIYFILIFVTFFTDTYLKEILIIIIFFTFLFYEVSVYRQKIN